MPGVVADAGRDRGAAAGYFFSYFAPRSPPQRRHFDGLAAQRGHVDVVLAGHVDQFDVLLAQAGLLQHPQHQRALRLTGAVGDLLALEVGQRLDVRRRARRPARTSGASSGSIVTAWKTILAWCRSTRRTATGCRRPRCSRACRRGRPDALRAAADVGPLDLHAGVRQLLVQPGHLEDRLDRRGRRGAARCRSEPSPAARRRRRASGPSAALGAVARGETGQCRAPRRRTATAARRTASGATTGWERSSCIPPLVR